MKPKANMAAGTYKTSGGKTYGGTRRTETSAHVRTVKPVGVIRNDMNRAGGGWRASWV